MRSLSADDFRDAMLPHVYEAVQRYRETGVVVWETPPDVPEAETSPACSACHDVGRVALRTPGPETRYIDCGACNIADERRMVRMLGKVPIDYRNATYQRYMSAAQTDEARGIGELAREWAEIGDGSVLLLGPLGSLKTTLASAIWISRVENAGIRRAEWIAAPDFLEEIRQSYDRDTGVVTSGTFEDARTCELLLLDDLGTENLTDRNTPWVQEQLYRLINWRGNNHLGTIITSNLSHEQLKNRLGEAIVSRIEGMCRPRIWLVDQGINFRTGRPNGR